MKFLEKIGNHIVNFCVRKMGVKPHNTELLNLPEHRLVEGKALRPIILNAEMEVDDREQIPEDYILTAIAKKLPQSKEFRDCVVLRRYQERPMKSIYLLQIAIMPADFF